MNPPIENCYWVVQGQLLAGEYPRDIDGHSSVEKINALLRAGVTVFIDLTEEEDGLLPYTSFIDGASYQRFPIPDFSIQDSDDVTTLVLDAIDYHIGQGRVVYLHCWGGVGRTGTMVGCWLARHGESGEVAYERLQELWQECSMSACSQSPDTEEQRQYILDWEEWD